METENEINMYKRTWAFPIALKCIEVFDRLNKKNARLGYMNVTCFKKLKTPRHQIVCLSCWMNFISFTLGDELFKGVYSVLYFHCFQIE